MGKMKRAILLSELKILNKKIYDEAKKEHIRHCELENIKVLTERQFDKSVLISLFEWAGTDKFSDIWELIHYRVLTDEQIKNLK